MSKEIALTFIRASVKAGAHPGDLLGPHLWPSSVNMPGKLADWTAGLDYAVGQGWIEKLPNEQYRLTDMGFAAAH